MKVSLHPEADEEFAGAVGYYSEISPALGARFYEEMERLLREAAANPERFRKFDPPARRHFSNDFPYAIIFLEKPDCVWVVAVMHMKRLPGYWRDRLSKTVIRKTAQTRRRTGLSHRVGLPHE